MLFNIWIDVGLGRRRAGKRTMEIMRKKLQDQVDVWENEYLISMMEGKNFDHLNDLERGQEALEGFQKLINL